MSGKRRMRAKRLAAEKAAANAKVPSAPKAITEPEAPEVVVKPKSKTRAKSTVRKMASKIVKSKEK